MNKRAFEIDTVEIPHLCEQLRTVEEHCHRQSTVSMERQEDKARKLETIFSLSSLRTQGHKAKELKTEKLRCELMAGVLERQVQEEQARKWP